MRSVPHPSHTPPPRAVALKAYHKAALGRTALRRLELEQRILQTVRHPHIIRGERGSTCNLRSMWLAASSCPADMSTAHFCCC